MTDVALKRAALETEEAISGKLLQEIERTAVELARLAGAEIVSALGGLLAVRYKGGSEAEPTWRDPVSEVDHKVEVLIRARLSERFPSHDILGEELVDRPGLGGDFVWAVDPVDGTTNFINGFPLFAASIGVVYRGLPVAGAVWCASTHALRAGVYHARRGGPLHFDDAVLEPKLNPAVRRRLAGEPDAIPQDGFPWEVRKTGSAALECAFVAAGLLRVARFARPNLWDIAGGIALVKAAGGEVQIRGDKGWHPLQTFEPTRSDKGGTPDLRFWHCPMIIGEREAVTLLCERHKS
jgi:myo-inositol-1(or 4)-monophosphatase